jgi:hypothetical protein
MNIYLFTFQIPELKPLTKRQRKAVYVCAFEALFAEQPSTLWTCNLWVFGGIAVGALAGGLAVAGGVSWPMAALGQAMPVVIAGGLAGAVVGSSLGAHWIHGKLRPYFRRVLEERKSEIARIG